MEMEMESSVGFTYDAEGNEDVADDFPRPEFKKRLLLMRMTYSMMLLIY